MVLLHFCIVGATDENDYLDVKVVGGEDELKECSLIHLHRKKRFKKPGKKSQPYSQFKIEKEPNNR